MTTKTALLVIEQIEPLIKTIREQKVILDEDLVRLNQVPMRVLNQAVKRNLDRFPEDFLFQVNQDEMASLRSQFVTLKSGRGQHRKFPPLAFTEHGAFMAATILNSPAAIQMSVFVVRTFIKLRHLVQGHQELAKKLDQLERKVSGHDNSIRDIVTAIRQLTSEPAPEPKPIGFHTILKQPSDAEPKPKAKSNGNQVRRKAADSAKKTRQ